MTARPVLPAAGADRAADQQQLSEPRLHDATHHECKWSLQRPAGPGADNTRLPVCSSQKADENDVTRRKALTTTTASVFHAHMPTADWLGCQWSCAASPRRTGLLGQASIYSGSSHAGVGRLLCTASALVDDLLRARFASCQVVLPTAQYLFPDTDDDCHAPADSRQDRPAGGTAPRHPSEPSDIGCSGSRRCGIERGLSSARCAAPAVWTLLTVALTLNLHGSVRRRQPIHRHRRALAPILQPFAVVVNVQMFGSLLDARQNPRTASIGTDSVGTPCCLIQKLRIQVSPAMASETPAWTRTGENVPLVSPSLS